MRLLVCGSREYTDRGHIFHYLDAFHAHTPVSVLIHGAARGADRIARNWAASRLVHTLPFPADWEQYGKAAGPIRNKQMLDEGKPDAVLAFPLPGSKGTHNMIYQAVEAGVPTKIVSPPDDGTVELNLPIDGTGHSPRAG